MSNVQTFEKIERLRASGVLSAELMPNQEYWSWKILRVEGFPAELCDVDGVCITSNELRFYW